MNGDEKSDPTIVAMKPANERPRGSKEWVERRVGAEGNVGGPHGVRAQERAATSSGIDRVRKAAQERKGEKFTTLLHHIDASLLRQAYDWLKRDAAPGVDGMTWDAYGEGLEAHLRDLESRIHLGSYRAQPSLRAYIPKPDGRQRPLGIAALEDKIVQRAVVEVLNAIYEADFLGFSYGFRPGRGQHDALDALAAGIESKAVNWILDADIKGFFDSISHEWMMRFMEHRIGDRRVLRLIRKWLTAGVMEDGVRQPATQGTPQGAVISPLLANIYLHYVYDLWAEQWRLRDGRGAIRRRHSGRLRAPVRRRKLPGTTTHPHGGIRLGVAPREDSPDRIRLQGRLRQGGPGGRQAGDVRLSWLHPYLFALTAGQVLAGPAYAA
jgi:retron-type reverse transcriptase